MADAGLGLQTGLSGWWAVFRGQQVRYPGLPTKGLFRVCRQPIYLSFALVTWFGPAWTVDKLWVASVLTTYCIVGPLLKEARYARIFGRAFEEYREAVPYLIPWRSR